MYRTLGLGVLAASNSLLSIGLQWYAVTVLGVGQETDALFAALMVPQLLISVGSGSLTYVLVPLFATVDPESRARQSWSFLQGLGLVTGVLTVLLSVAAPFWVPWTVPGFGESQQELTVALVRVQALGIVFTPVATVVWATHYARQRFFWADCSPLVANLAALALVVATMPRYGIYAVAWAMTVRPAIQIVLLLPGLGRYRLPDWSAASLGPAWRSLRPLLLGSAYYRSELIVDRLLASLAPSGGLSLFVLARQLYEAGGAVLYRAVASPAAVVLSGLAARGEWGPYADNVRKRLWTVAWIGGGAVAAILVLGRPVLALVFEHRKFSASDTELLWELLLILGLMFACNVLSDFLNSAFYAFGDTATPTRIMAAVYTVFIGIKLLAFWALVIYGLALAASCHALVLLVGLGAAFRGSLRAKRSTQPSPADARLG